MGDTIRITFADNVFTEITGLTLGVTYDLQNIRRNEVILQQVVAQPGVDEEGKILLPFKSATIIKETAAVWIRSRSGTGIAYYNARA